MVRGNRATGIFWVRSRFEVGHNTGIMRPHGVSVECLGPPLFRKNAKDSAEVYRGAYTPKFNNRHGDSAMSLGPLLALLFFPGDNHI